MRRALAILLVLVTVLASASCSDDEKPTACGAAEDLASSVQALGDIDLAQEGTSGVQSAIEDVQSSWQEFDDVSRDRFQTQVDALGDALTQLEDALGSVSGDDLGASVTQVGDAITAVSQAWTDLADAITTEFSDCDLQ